MRHIRLNRTLRSGLAALAAWLLAACYAQSDDAIARWEGPLNALERRLAGDAADHRLDEHTLFEAALIAGGVDDAKTLASYAAKLNGWAGQVAATADGLEPRAKAQRIHEFLFREVLRHGYCRDCTTLPEAIDRGRFNCVSATVLFNGIARRCGLDCQAVEYPRHVVSRMLIAGATFDVETTCRRWFELLDDPRRHDELPDKKAMLGRAQRSRVCGDIELAAMIYYNRGVGLLADKRFAEAVAVNAKALRLDRDSRPARANLLAALNNWAVTLGAAKQYAAAAEKLQAGLDVDVHYAAITSNYAQVHHEWAISLCEQKRFDDALKLLGDAAPRVEQKASFERARLDVYRRWARVDLEADRLDAALALFDRAARDGVNAESHAAVEIAELNDRAIALLSQQRADDAVRVLDEACRRHPEAAVLADNHRVAVMRWAEPAFAAGDFAEAIRRSTHGSRPESLHVDIRNNVRYGYRQWARQLEAAGRHAEAWRIARQAHDDPFLTGGAPTAGGDQKWYTADLTTGDL